MTTDRNPITDRKETPKRILFVDDEPSIRDFASRALVRAGYEVDVAANGMDAWDTLQARVFDLLVTDFNMPRLSGLDLFERTRARHPDLPVILITGYLPTEELARTPLLQPTAILLKPFRIADLLDTVRIVAQLPARIVEGNGGPPRLNGKPHREELHE